MIKLLDLTGVSETMLLTLYCRAQETKSKNPVFLDHKAVEITGKLDEILAASSKPLYRALAAGRLPAGLPTTISLRARAFDRYAEAFLLKHPDGVIVNLGCGLDTRSLRADNGTALWFDLDLPEVVALRRQLVEETGRSRFIASSVLDFGWIDEIRAAGRNEHLFLAEGLFMYLEEDQVRSIVLRLLESFPGCELVTEVVSTLGFRLLQTKLGRLKLQRQMCLGEGVTFRSGMDSRRHFEKWSPEIEFLDCWSYFDENEPKLGWMNVLRFFAESRCLQYTVHYRLGKLRAPVG